MNLPIIVMKTSIALYRIFKKCFIGFLILIRSLTILKDIIRSCTHDICRYVGTDHLMSILS